MTMRRFLGSVLPVLLPVLLLTGVVAGCGDDEPFVTDQPGPTSTPPTKGTQTGDAVDFELVELITETAAGGQVDAGAAAVPLGDDTAVQEFTAQFTTGAMQTRVQEAVDKAAVTDDMVLYGAVVAVGCDSPDDVAVTAADEGLVITALKVPDPKQECFAPMTTVALVLVPAESVT
jgi:hypothetical protein